MTDRAPAPADVEAIAEVLAEFWWGCQGGVGADTPPPNDGDRNLAAALLASPALATLRAHERATALTDAATEIPAQVAIARETRNRIAEWLRDRADRQEPHND